MSHIAIHPASEQERLAAYANAHEAWGGGLPLQEFLERRSRSAAHNRARWWVAVVEGQVAASLGCHPLTFSYCGAMAPGFGICAVHTAPSYRRRGLADQLCKAVIAEARHRGDQIGLLFSDIAPEYYARMGFLRLPALSFRAVRTAELAASGPALRYENIEPLQHREFFQRCYDLSHSTDELFLARDADYWEYVFARHSQALYFRLHDTGGPGGYFILGAVNAGVTTLEIALETDDPGIRVAAVRAAARAALEQGAQTLVGWLRPQWGVEPWFTPEERTKAIPMVLPLWTDAGWSGSSPPRHHFWHTDHF